MKKKTLLILYGIIYLMFVSGCLMMADYTNRYIECVASSTFIGNAYASSNSTKPKITNLRQSQIRITFHISRNQASIEDKKTKTLCIANIMIYEIRIDIIRHGYVAQTLLQIYWVSIEGNKPCTNIPEKVWEDILNEL